jgi:hypothetical protein
MGTDMSILKAMFDLRSIPYEEDGEYLIITNDFHCVYFEFKDGRLVAIQGAD